MATPALLCHKDTAQGTQLLSLCLDDIRVASMHGKKELHSDLRPERSGMAGMVEVTFLSLKSVYSILDRYRFPLVRSEVSCLCDCPGGAAHCHPGLDLCQNQVVKIFLRWKYSNILRKYLPDQLRQLLQPQCPVQWVFPPLAPALRCRLLRHQGGAVQHQQQPLPGRQAGQPQCPGTATDRLEEPERGGGY